MKHFENFNYKSDAVAKFKEIYGKDKEEEFKEISMSSVTVLPQVRTEFGDLGINELAESIKKYGVIQPVVVVRDTNKGYRLIIGERRFRGSKLAGRDTIPARIFKNLTDEEIMVLQLMENIHRDDLKPLELAESYKRLKDSGRSTRDIANLVKKSQPHIVNTLKLLSIDEDLKKKVISGLSPSKAIEYSKLTDEEKKGIDIGTAKRDELRGINKKPISRLSEDKNNEEDETDEQDEFIDIENVGRGNEDGNNNSQEKNSESEIKKIINEKIKEFNAGHARSLAVETAKPEDFQRKTYFETEAVLKIACKNKATIQDIINVLNKAFKA